MSTMRNMADRIVDLEAEIARCREIAERDGKDYSALAAERNALLLQVSALQEDLTEERKRCSELFDQCDKQGAELGAICDERQEKLEAANRLNEKLQKTLTRVLEIADEYVDQTYKTWEVTHGIGADARNDCAKLIAADLRTLIENRKEPS